MNLKKHLQHKIFKIIGNEASKLGNRAFVIGGYTRDLILNRPSKDIDFVTEGSGIELAKNVAKKVKVKRVNYFKTYGTAQFVYDKIDLEFVGARKESYRHDSRNPLVEEGSLQDDQNRRDFTINALAISLEESNFGEVIDPFRGLQDLEDQIIRTPLDPDITFSDDPLRMMRAIRFATQLNFTIESNTLQAISRNAERIKIITKERIITELNKIIMSPVPSIGFKLLYNSGLLALIFPEMVKLQGVEIRNGIGHKDNFYHTLQVLDNIAPNTDNLWLRWAAILHDIAKPPTKRFSKTNGWTFHGHEDLGARMVPKIFKRMKLPLDSKMKFVQKMVQLHLRPIALTKDEVTDTGIRRLLFDAGDDIDELMTLCRADITSKNDWKVKTYLKNYDKVVTKLNEVEAKDHIRNFQPPIDGETIMKTFNMKPCYEIGVIKNSIKDAILDNKINNDYDEAYKFMLQKGLEIGLTPVDKNK